MRAEGTPGDSDRRPRINVIARYEGARPGPCVHFNGHIDVVPGGAGLDRRPVGAARSVTDASTAAAPAT